LRSLSSLYEGLSYEFYDWLSILRFVRKNMTVLYGISIVTVIYVQDTSNASPVNMFSAIVDLNHVLRRRSIENVCSADAVVTDKVVSTLSSEI